MDIFGRSKRQELSVLDALEHWGPMSARDIADRTSGMERDGVRRAIARLLKLEQVSAKTNIQTILTIKGGVLREFGRRAYTITDGGIARLERVT